MQPRLPARWRTPSTAYAHGSAQQTRQPAVFEHPAARLARRAVVDRVLLVVDAGDRCPADVAWLAEAVVHTVDARVLRAGEPQLEPTEELGVDRLGEPLHLLPVQVAGQRIRRQLGRVEDLVRPRAAYPGQRALVPQERVQAPAVAREDLAQPLGADARRLWAEVRHLRVRSLPRQQPDSRPLLRAGLGQHELGAA